MLVLLTFLAQLRKSSQDSSSKTKDSRSQPASTSASASSSSSVPPPPPPNTAKPLPQPVLATPGLPGASVNNNTNHSLPTQAQASYNRAPPSAQPQTSAPERRYNSNQSSIPPIVVVNSDPAPDPAPRSGQFGSPERTSLGLDLPGSNATPPRANTLNRLRSGPRDTIPIVGKPPRKQRSSRFVVTERVEIERLAPFAGLFLFSALLLFLLTISHQKCPLPKGLSFLSRNSTNVVCYSTSTMPARSSEVNKSKHRRCMKCSSISPPNVG